MEFPLLKHASNSLAGEKTKSDPHIWALSGVGGESYIPLPNTTYQFNF